MAHAVLFWSKFVSTYGTTPLSEPERQLLVPYSTKGNAFCELGRQKIQAYAHRRHLLLLNMVQGAAFLVLIEV